MVKVLKMKVVLTLLLGFISTFALHAQELNATVQVNSAQLTILDPEVVKSFETTVRDFLNNTKFTNKTYEVEERIQCSFTFTIPKGGEISASEFKADLLIQSPRPVFNSDYQTTLINYLDKGVNIEYALFQPIEFSPNNYTSNLSSLLTFYAYIVLGMDSDSFAPMSGEEYYQEAQNIITSLPATASDKDKSWGVQGGSRTRFSFLREINNPRARGYRQMLYDYHRQGLDVMSGDPVAGRAIIAKSIEQLKTVKSATPNSLLVPNYSSAKAEELVEIFLTAPTQERRRVYQVMIEVDPASNNKYRSLR